MVKSLKNYDTVVIGAGVFGSWIAYYLQDAKGDVALIDAYGPAHSRASSGGESRIIRMGYGADETYTRWSYRSLALWQGFFERTSRNLFHRTGVLWLARAEDPYTVASMATLKKACIEFELLQRDDLDGRYPQFNFGEITWAIYEPDSGVLMARQAVQLLAQEIIRKGADFYLESVIAPFGSGRLNEVVMVSGERISAGNFVFACGPWMPKLFPDLLGDRIHPTRQEVFFFGTPPGDTRFRSPQMPTWIDFGAEIYGVPDLENRGLKVALDRHGERFDPDTGERNVNSELLQETRRYLAHRLPDMKNAPLVEARVCQYENTSSGDFLIDRHPDFENVWLVGGGSGHGFKHGPALGEYVSRKMIDGSEIEERFTLATKATAWKRSVF
jgi:monomeric sarcosine oxidase